ncbi:MAG: hypothetical protein AABZ60_15015 [Planctomycetota bacterium]
MKYKWINLFWTISFLWAQYKVDISPLLCPAYRTGFLTLFRIDIQDLSGNPLPTQGEIQVALNLNGLIFSKTFHLEEYTLQKYFVFEAIVPPKLPKGNDFHLWISGALNHHESIPSNTFFLPYPTKKKLGGIFFSTPSRQEWWSHLLTPFSNQLYPLEFPPEFLSDFRFLDPFDYLIWEKPLSPKIHSELWKNLQSWILSGGILIGTEKTLEDSFFKDFFKLPPPEVFSLGKTLGEEEQWQKFQIDPQKEVFWNQKYPFLIALNYGAGKMLFLKESLIPDPKNLALVLDPLWSRKLPSVVAPESFLPFQHTVSTPPFLQRLLLGFTGSYLALFLALRRKKKLKQWTLSIFFMLILVAYFVWGNAPVLAQEVRIFWLSTRGESWQRLCLYSSLCPASLEISSPDLQSESPHKISWILPQFYENRDFEYVEQRALKSWDSPPDWHFQYSLKKISRMRLRPLVNYVWEQRGIPEKPSPRLIQEDKQNPLKEQKLYNPTENTFRFIFWLQNGKWFFLDRLSANERRSWLWLNSFEEGLQKVPLPYQRVLKYLLETTRSHSSKMIAFPDFSSELFMAPKALSFPVITVYVSLE